MDFQITDVSNADLDDVWKLNQSEVPHVGEVDIERMHWFADNASYFRIARSDHGLAAFLIGLRPGTTYASLNYRWFCDRYDDFAYIDRIAVAASKRRHKLASRLYDDFARQMPDSISCLTCEVNILPPNESSLQFHMRLGFKEVGTLTSDNGNKKVAMLLKEL